jgi:glucose-6-phosphate 1-dehydrogenase
MAAEGLQRTHKQKTEVSRIMPATVSVNSTTEMAPSNVMVIFGGTGDLTRRKLFPALHHLWKERLGPERFAVVGVGREALSEAAYRDMLDAAVREYYGAGFDASVWEQMLRSIHYIPGEFADPELYAQLEHMLRRITGESQIAPNYLFYFATPPGFFAEIAAQLGRAGLLNESGDHWRRVVVEKPFGHDLPSALALNLELHRVMEEQQIYRIDHYLGKETVQNILAFRFANSTIEPIWNRRYIDHVQITVAESLGIEERGGYYDQAGALRDMIPNHLLAVLAVVAMEPPTSFGADAIRDEQTKVLRAIQPIGHDEVLAATVRGQYGAGVLPGGERVPAYRSEPKVDPESNTETYASMRLNIDTWRWAGVPFYLRTGKRMPGRFTEVVIQYMQAPNFMFRDSLLKRENVPANSMVLRIQPNEGIGLNFNAKVPGPATHLGSVDMDFSYAEHFSATPTTGYETLLYDCMTGDATLFKRADNIEAAWALMEPVLDVWAALPARDFPNYAAGTWGPEAADQLLTRDGRSWRPCRFCQQVKP